MQTALMLTSNEHSVMFRMMTNGDLCDFLRSSVAQLSLTRAKKMTAKINATERNTSPVLHNLNSTTVILSQHQHYIYIDIYIYVYIPISVT